MPDEETGEVEVVETFEPEVLISLTVPKEGVKEFAGRHWLGGRFVPEYVCDYLGDRNCEMEGAESNGLTW